MENQTRDLRQENASGNIVSGRPDGIKTKAIGDKFDKVDERFIPIEKEMTLLKESRDSTFPVIMGLVAVVAILTFAVSSLLQWRAEDSNNISRLAKSLQKLETGHSRVLQQIRRPEWIIHSTYPEDAMERFTVADLVFEINWDSNIGPNKNRWLEGNGLTLESHFAASYKSESLLHVSQANDPRGVYIQVKQGIVKYFQLVNPTTNFHPDVAYKNISPVWISPRLNDQGGRVEITDYRDLEEYYIDGEFYTPSPVSGYMDPTFFNK